MKKEKPYPPNLFLRFFRWFCHPKLAKYIEGDLMELYEERIKEKGKRKADIKFILDVLLLFRPAIIKPAEGYQQLNTYGMYKSYFKIGWRNLLKSKAHTLTNVFGLSVGLACCLLITFYLRDELSFDRYHEKADRIQRIVTEGWAKMPPALAPALQESYPHVVEQAVRLWPVFAPAKMRQQDVVFIETGIVFADANVFSVFSWPLLVGNPQKALAEKNSIVLTQTMAAKYFGTKDPIGQSLKFWGKDITVTGIAADVPTNSHLSFDFLVSFNTLNEVMGNNLNESWEMPAFYTYVLQRDGTQLNDLELATQQLFKINLTAKDVKPHLQPITSIHLHSQLEGEFKSGGNIVYLYIMGTMALLILTLACINFINLTIARAVTRNKEVGMRKVMGAFKRQLIEQFFGEAMIVTLIALGFAVIIVSVSLPAFNQFTEKSISLLDMSNPRLLMGVLITIMIIGFVGGTYPALFLSKFQPIHALKGDHGKFNLLTRKGLIVFQFMISTFFMAAMAVVLLQLNFIQNKDLGFDKEHVLILDGDRFPQLKTDLQTIAGVKYISGAPQIVGSRLPLSRYQAEGVLVDSASQMVHYGVTPDFIETMDIRLVAGRSFTGDAQLDEGSFVLNESAIRELGWKSDEAIGKSFSMFVPPLNGGAETWRVGKIIGVAHDFHFDALYKTVSPLAIYPSYDLNFTLVRVENLNAAILGEIQKSWKKINADAPFNYFLLDDRLKQNYISEEKLGSIMSAATVLAVSIACLGLLSLVAFSANQRTKEIGIRKVMGASVIQLVAMLSADFLKLIALATFIALPLAYLTMQAWLKNFAYQVELSWIVFFLTGITTLTIAILTVCFQSQKAAVVNPVKSLRSE